MTTWWTVSSVNWYQLEPGASAAAAVGSGLIDTWAEPAVLRC